MKGATVWSREGRDQRESFSYLAVPSYEFMREYCDERLYLVFYHLFCNCKVHIFFSLNATIGGVCKVGSIIGGKIHTITFMRPRH